MALPLPHTERWAGRGAAAGTQQNSGQPTHCGCWKPGQTREGQSVLEGVPRQRGAGTFWPEWQKAEFPGAQKKEGPWGGATLSLQFPARATASHSQRPGPAHRSPHPGALESGFGRPPPTAGRPSPHLPGSGASPWQRSGGGEQSLPAGGGSCLRRGKSQVRRPYDVSTRG